MGGWIQPEPALFQIAKDPITNYPQVILWKSKCSLKSLFLRPKPLFFLIYEKHRTALFNNKNTFELITHSQKCLNWNMILTGILKFDWLSLIEVILEQIDPFIEETFTEWLHFK